MDYYPLTTREIWDKFHGEIVNHVGIKTLEALKTRLHCMSDGNGGVYEIEADIPYGPKKYIISIKGISVLKTKGLIDENHELAARRRLLGIIEEVMPPSRYNRIVSYMRRRRR